MKKILWTAIILLGITACAQNNIMDISGKIYIQGSEPHTYLVIEETKTNRVYKIVNPSDFNLSHKQKQVLRLKAVSVKSAVGPNFPAEIKVVGIK